MFKFKFAFITLVILVAISVELISAQKGKSEKGKTDKAGKKTFYMKQIWNKEDGDKRQLTILYEALCPDSERFMAQLGPVYEALKDYIQLEFVPYGLTKLLCKRQIHGKCERPTFTCKHGPAGCKANRQHDCALQYSESQEKQMNFIMCTMGPNKSPVEKCLALLGYSIYDVDTCMTFDEGTELQLKSHEKTEPFKPKVLPIVMFDKTFSTEVQEAALKDFRVLTCSLMANKYQLINEQTAPVLCKTSEIFPNMV